MDRRVFELRPTDNAARRRNSIAMALIILLAGGLWLYASQSLTHPVPAKTGVHAP